MSWGGQRVLVTGATGLLGSAFVNRMVSEGADVVAVVRDNIARSRLRIDGTMNKIDVVHGDIVDSRSVLRAVNEYEVETVVHLAAQTIVGTAHREITETLNANIQGAWNVFDACRKVDTVDRILFASTDKAYGDAPTPTPETAPLQGKNPYDASKSCADLLAQAYAHTYGLNMAITRMGNLYGSGDLNFNRIVPGTIVAALQGQAPTIRSDGTPRRDYLYVEDAVDADLRLLDHMASTSLRGEAFNFSNGDNRSVLQVVEAILSLVGNPALKPKVQGQAVGEILVQGLDCTKAETVLGWTPSTTFEDGIAQCIEWYRRYLER